jgi:hypothetical protein
MTHLPLAALHDLFVRDSRRLGNRYRGVNTIQSRRLLSLCRENRELLPAQAIVQIIEFENSLGHPRTVAESLDVSLPRDVGAPMLKIRKGSCL